MRTSDSPQKSELVKLMSQAAGVVALPVIPFYMLSYRLMGRRCTYRWPETDVRPVDYSPVRLWGSWQETPYFASKLITGLMVVVLNGGLMVLAWLLGMPIRF